eukprot:g22274.t1
MKKSGKAHFEEHGCPDTRAFAALLLKRFETLEEAYRHFDGNKNYQLGMTEFVSGARALHFTGNARAVFKETILYEEAVTSKTRRDEVLERKQRSPIQPPSRHMRSTCLASSHIRFPEAIGLTGDSWCASDAGACEAEHISSSAGFFSFKREGTGRSDLLLHPDQLPGCDGENFSKEHGPGYCQKGPEHFAEVMTDMHPLRGNKFKIGSMVTRTERFGPAIPSVEGKKDLDHSASNFATYKGQMPQTNWRTDGTGAQVLLSKRARMCLTTGFTDSFSVGLVKPVPFGPWGESRMTLRLSRLKSQSETSLKYKDKRD